MRTDLAPKIRFCLVLLALLLLLLFLLEESLGTRFVNHGDGCSHWVTTYQ